MRKNHRPALIALVVGIYLGIWADQIPGLRSLQPRPTQSQLTEAQLARMERFLRP